MKETMYLNKKVIGDKINIFHQLDDMIEKYELAEQHWMKKIYKMVQKRELDRMNFNPV